MATGLAIVVSGFSAIAGAAAVIAPILTVASLVYSFTQSVDEPAGFDAGGGAVNLTPVSTPGLAITEPDLTEQLAAEEQQLAVASEQKDIQRRRQVLRQLAFGNNSIFSTPQQAASPSITG